MQKLKIGTPALLGVLLAVAAQGADAESGSKRSAAALEYQRSTIYHSPQTPGFTSWVGACLLPDDSILVTFTQATGPIEGRPRIPEAIGKKLGWPPVGRPMYDMTGLELANLYLHSTDGGKTWKKVSAYPFKSCMNGCSKCLAALADGTILRSVWGHYLPHDPELPKTGYLQRSHDGTKTWGPPELLMDPKRYLVWPARIRVLRDGRLIVIGGISYTKAGELVNPEGNLPRGQCVNKPFLVVSEDHGKTWSPPLNVSPPEHRENWTGGVEYDVAELPNGDLLCVFRRVNPDKEARKVRGKNQVRWQGLLKKQGETWVPEQFGPAPFPHSGHPDLLVTREGLILHVATSGIHWTDDAGRSWHRLNVPGTRYYPRSVQTSDGRICIFSHVGSDNAYGSVDQSIKMDTFRLNVSP